MTERVAGESPSHARRDRARRTLDVPHRVRLALRVVRLPAPSVSAPLPPESIAPAAVEWSVLARQVSLAYVRGSERVTALAGIDLAVTAGEFVAIMGRSGSGKTSLFNVLGGLLRPDAGSVFIDEVDIAQLDAQELAWLRCRKIGYVFQSYNLVNTMSALDNVCLPLRFAGQSSDEARDRAAEVLARVGLADRLLHTPAELSAGQQQRVALARALAHRPALLLADEPTANLDGQTAGEVVGLLHELHREQGVTVICATHDAQIVERADRIVTMDDGRIAALVGREERRTSTPDTGGPSPDPSSA